MSSRVDQKNFFVKFNPSSPQIVLLVIETSHTVPNFSSFGSQGEEGMQFEISNFRRKIWILAHFSITFSVKILGI